MFRKVVAMPLIPGRYGRGSRRRSGLDYAKYGRATWRWWCEQRGIDFVVFDQPLGDSKFADMPPTIQRWLIPELLIRDNDKDTRVALVDADTMIRWDAPDIFDQAEGFAAVRGRDQNWISRSIQAYQPLFPGVSLPVQEYFNAGVVVLGNRQVPTVRAFLEFTLRHWTKLDAMMSFGDLGTDQTPLNFVLRREGEPVHLLPDAFNLLHCFPMDPALNAIEFSPAPDPILFSLRAFSRPGAFEFFKRGYIWHFSNVVALRSLVMREAWRRVSHNYPGNYLSEG